MDSQHRHELQENELADWLTDAIEWAKPNAAALVGAALAVVLAFFGWSWLQSANSANEQAAWNLFSRSVVLGAPDLNELETAASFTDSSVAPWASITWADGQLLTASVQFFRDRAASKEAAEKATETYTRLAGDRSAPQILRDRAKLGLARAAELTGDAQAAAKLYAEVSGAFADIAAKRSEALATSSAKQDLEWLAASKPTAGGGATAPGKTPDFAPSSIDTPSDEPEESADDSLDAMLEKFKQESGEEDASAEDASAEDGADPAEGDDTAPPAADAEGQGADPARRPLAPADILDATEDEEPFVPDTQSQPTPAEN